MNVIEKELRILMLEDLEEDAGLVDRALQKEKIAFTRIRVDTLFYPTIRFLNLIQSRLLKFARKGS